MKRIWFGVTAVIVMALLITAWVWRSTVRDWALAAKKTTLPTPQVYVVQSPTSTTSKVATSTNPFDYTGTLPKEINLAVPFLSQAPKQNWDMPYQEACEEASLLMVDSYYKGRTKPFTPAEGDREVLALTTYVEKNGYAPDTTAQETATFGSAYFGRKVVVKEITKLDDLKKPLAKGYPVIIPAHGKSLGNPNFRNGGPLYHMLVIKGYTKKGQWITNDPGTRRGADYVYSSQTLWNAIHDWNGGNVKQGKKMVLILLPDKK